MDELQKRSGLMNNLLVSLLDEKITKEEQFLLGIKAIITGWK